jgi:hypothetical protein
MNRSILKLLSICLLLSCKSDNKEDLVFRAFSDMLMGHQELKLNRRQEFNLYLSAAEKTGTYSVSEDTIYLSYKGKIDGKIWPVKFFIDSTNKKIESVGLTYNTWIEIIDNKLNN